MTATVEQVTVVLPLPSGKLSKNGRIHWSERQRLYRAHREQAGWVLREALSGARPLWDDRVRVRCIWRYAGPTPDMDNTIGRLAAYLDGAQDAGLLADDRCVVGYDIEYHRVPRREQGLDMTLWREEAR